MKKQSVKWTGLALDYVSDIVATTYSFITKLVALTRADEHVAREMLSTLMDGLIERYVTALDQVRFLLHIERTGTSMTLNLYFNDNLEKWYSDDLRMYRTPLKLDSCQNRMTTTMEKRSFDDCTHDTVVKLDDVVKNPPLSNTEHVVQDIHDILFSHYKVARKRFVDNVCVHVVDHFLVNGPETPLTLFSPSFVSGLDVDQLDSIAGEDFVTKRRWQQVKKEIQSLEVGRKAVIDLMEILLRLQSS
jgi:hypothetical protein